MKSPFLNITVGLILAALTLTSCALTNPGPDLEATHFAGTVVAELTRRAPTITPVASKTPRPSPTNTLAPTNTLPPPTLPPTATPDVIFSDDFSSSHGWPVAESNNWAFGYENGDYFIFVNYPNAAIWSVRFENHADVRIQTHALRSEGPQNGYYGVVCRFIDASNYYMLVVGEDGSYGIGKMLGGSLDFIDKRVDESGIVYRGQTPNQVEGDCLGSNLTLVVNGQTLMQVQDPSFKQGNIGLVAGVPSTYGLKVIFSDFLVLKP